MMAPSSVRTPGFAGLDELPAPSSLLSSRWPRDNLVTAHPAHLYDGRVLEPIDGYTLEHLLAEFAQQRPSFEVLTSRMGVLTWDLVCSEAREQFVLQVPRALDEPGQHGRAKRELPRLNSENARQFGARGLARFVVEPRSLLTLSKDVPAALFEALPQHFPISIGAGCVRLRLPDGALIALGPRGSADVLAEMIAALVYHYDADLEGGTAVTDVVVNDTDFWIKRRGDGTLDLRLTAVRRRESGIDRNRFVLYLLGLMAYEDFGVDGNLTGLPLLASNPAVTFEGLTRGLAYRRRDLGGSEADGVDEARRWLSDFGTSREGRAYRRWVQRFLEGRLPLRFRDDLREHWWRLFPLERRQRLFALRGRADPLSGAADSAHTLRVFLDRLSRDIGRIPEEGAIRINDLRKEDLIQLLSDAQVEASLKDGVAEQLFNEWPHKSLDTLLARVPRARGLRRLKSRVAFGDVIPLADEGTLKSLGAAPKSPPARPLANHELFDARFLPPALHARAVATFMTFESYMDAALHHPSFGYYGHRVIIGKEGHFDTHPEELSPHYGQWVAELAFKAWRDLIAQRELAPDEPFSMIEFGAGSGRLARDVLDAVASAASAEPQREHWKAFQSRLEYRIYETSQSLRERQSELLAQRAVIAEGDARRPAETLRRDFPSGVKGLIVSNEVPDAFGVHKVALSRAGDAFVALVVPRIEQAARESLDGDLWRRIEALDASLRGTFAFDAPSTELYIDQNAFIEVMLVLARLDAKERDARLARLWFEEAYVSASAIPELASHLSTNAREYATALASEDSGVVVYVNLHANDFMRELGSSLQAGFIATLDYGDTTWGLVQGARRGDFPFRVYGDQRGFVPRPNDPYVAPGTQDLTADVNFSDLANAAATAGLTPIHFGPERDVAGDALPALLRQPEREPFAKFLGHPGFKFLLVGHRPTAVFSTSLMTPLPLAARERDVAKSERAKIGELERALRGGA